MKQVKKFIDNGDKVKITLRFRGREMTHQALGVTVLDRVKEDTEDQGRENPHYCISQGFWIKPIRGMC